MLFFKLLSVFWFSITSLNVSNANIDSDSVSYQESNVFENYQEEPLTKNINFYVDTYYIGFSELGNELVYNSLLSILIDDASIESINFVNYNAWYNGRYFKIIANDIGLRPLTTDFAKHKFRFYDNSILIMVWDNTDYYGIKIKKSTIPGGQGSTYYSYCYHFSWSNTSPDSVPTSFFADSMSVYISGKFGFAYQHYNVQPGDPTEPSGVENHAYTAFSVLWGDEVDSNYNIGYANGFVDGQNTRDQIDYDAGYEAGLVDGALENPEISAIFTGILNVGLLPVNVFLEIFNFEIFGISVSGLVSGLLTMSIIIIIVRFLFGGKNDK